MTLKSVFKQMVYASIAIFVLSVATNMIHEVGHATACSIYGHEFDIAYAVTICHNDNNPDEVLGIGLMGGGMGALASLLLAIFVKPGWFRSVAVALIVSQSAMAVFETFTHDWYLKSSTPVISGLFLSTLAYFMFRWIFNPKPSSKTIADFGVLYQTKEVEQDGKTNITTKES